MLLWLIWKVKNLVEYKEQPNSLRKIKVHSITVEREQGLYSKTNGQSSYWINEDVWFALSSLSCWFNAKHSSIYTYKWSWFSKDQLEISNARFSKELVVAAEGLKQVD